MTLDLIPTDKPICPECHRVFNLNDPNDAADWYYGHDCEAQ